MRHRCGSLTGWALCAILAVVGCGTATFAVQQYDGNALPRERIALLRLNGGEALRLEMLDGERLDYQVTERDTRVHIEMLPGVHEIGITDPATGLMLVRRFLAVAGKVYRPANRGAASTPQAGDTNFAIFEVDAGDDGIIGKVVEYHPPKRPAVVPSATPSVDPSLASAPSVASATSAAPSAPPTAALSGAAVASTAPAASAESVNAASAPSSGASVGAPPSAMAPERSTPSVPAKP